MINPSLLRTFCTLVEVGHFTRTAEHLYMTQSGVSQHVRKLEAQVGGALLVRQGKQFTLTDVGHRLYQEGKQIIRSLTHLEQSVRNDPAYEGVVRIMSPGSVGLKLYPHMLALQQQHPKLKIEYRFAPNSDVEASIAESATDIGLMTSLSVRDEVSWEAVAQEALFLVTPADVVKPDWEKLQQLGFIDHPDGAHHASLLLGANFPEFEHSNRIERNGFSNQISLILEPVSLGLGFTVLPAYAVEAFHQPELIRAHRLPQPVSETLYLCINRDQPLPHRVASVISETKKWL